MHEFLGDNGLGFLTGVFLGKEAQQRLPVADEIPCAFDRICEVDHRGSRWNTFAVRRSLDLEHLLCVVEVIVPPSASAVHHVQ